ncbi:MAG: hypothetical protein ACK4FG_02325 [Brevundimonas sp.]
MTGDARIKAAAAIPASFTGSPKSVLPSFRLDLVCVARFVILSNGNIHYLWDLKQGNPNLITKFPSPDDIKDHNAFQLDAERQANEVVESTLWQGLRLSVAGAVE